MFLKMITGKAFEIVLRNY